MSDEGKAPAITPDAKEVVHPTIEEHAKAKKTPAWAFACAKTFHAWGTGQRMSAADFDKAVSAAINHPAG